MLTLINDDEDNERCNKNFQNFSIFGGASPSPLVATIINTNFSLGKSLTL